MGGRLTIIGGGVVGLMTAYYAPWVGKVLAQLAVQRGTVYDIGRFSPARFAGGAPVTTVVPS